MGALVFPSAKEAKTLRRFLRELASGNLLRLERTSLELTPELVGLFRQLPEPMAQREPVRKSAFLDHMEKVRERGQKLVDELVQKGQELGMGY